MNKFAFISAVVMISFLFIFKQHSWAVTNDCVQKRATLPAPYNIYTQANPLKITPQTILAGKKLYKEGAKPFGCIPCHGILGNGKGMTARYMTIKPRDFTCRAMMKDIPDGQLFWIIRNGSKGTEMMSFKTLKDDEIWQIVSYIRQFSN
jgi:mono/diheme cytochrome c family protein